MKGLLDVLAESAMCHGRCPRCDIRLPEHELWCSWPAYAQDLHVEPQDRQPDDVEAAGGPRATSVLPGGAHREES